MTPSLTFTLKCHKIEISVFILICSYLFRCIIFSLLCIQLTGCGYKVIRVERVKAQYVHFENRTPFPSLSVNLKKLWYNHYHKCPATRVILSLSNPLGLATNIAVEQSILSLKLKLPNRRTYADQELVTYSPLQSVNEEDLLNQVTYRLARRMYFRCKSYPEKY